MSDGTSWRGSVFSPHARTHERRIITKRDDERREGSVTGGSGDDDAPTTPLEP
jgi:hypothetical protein